MTKKIVFVLLIAFAVSSFAQTYTAVSASAVKDKNGALVTGTIQFVPDRQFGWTGINPAGCCQKDVPLIATLTAGAFTLNVPRATAINPAGVCFSVFIRNSAGTLVQGPDGYRCLQPSGATYNFDSYVPGAVPIPNSPTTVVPTDCNTVSSGYVIQKINPDGTVNCVAGGAGGGTWGSITGLLSDQSDLNTALGLKAPLANPTFNGTVAGVTASMVGLGSVTNDAQTKAAVVPNTVPTAGQIHVGNAGGTAFADVSMSGDATLASTGALTLANTAASAGTTGDATHTTALTVDAKGRVTGNVSTAIALPESAVTSLVSDLALLAPKANPTFTGIVTFPAAVASGAGAGNFEYNGGTFNTTSQGAGSTRIGADSGGVSSFNEQGLVNLVLPIQNGSLIANDTSTGTLANGLVCIASSKAISCPTSTTTGVVGIAVQGAGTSSNVTLRSSGEQSCIFENTAVFGNWFIPGTSTRGNCRDSGTASTSAAPTGAVGIAIEAGAAGARKIVFMGAQGGAGAVSSVFTRTGAVVAAASDYSLDQIANPASAKNFALGTNGVTLSTTSTTTVPFTVDGGAKFGTANLLTVKGNGANAFNIDTNFSANFFGSAVFQDATARFTDANAGGFEFKNGNNGNIVAGVDDVSGANAAFYVNLTATSSLTAGQLVKVDTSNASKVVVVTTADASTNDIAIGFVTNSASTAANNARVAFAGIITTPLLGTGTCSVGDTVIIDTTTNGRIKCTATPTVGQVLGKALTAQASVGSAVSVMIGFR